MKLYGLYANGELIAAQRFADGTVFSVNATTLRKFGVKTFFRNLDYRFVEIG